MEPRMRVWLLAPKIGVTGWDPPYGTAQKMVVRATKARSARKHASGSAGTEGPMVWLDPEKTTCEELTRDGPAGVVVCDILDG